MPSPDGAEQYTIKKQGMFSADYHCYQTPGFCGPDECNRQIWLNKAGSWKSGKAKIDVENFYRTTLGEPNDPNDDKIGQVMWGAEFVDTPSFQQHVSWGEGRHERYLGYFDGYDSDGDDQYFERAYPSYHSHNTHLRGRQVNHPRVYNKFLVKWSTNTYAKIRPGRCADGSQFRPGLDLVLHVFAKGTATRVTTKERVRVEHRDGEGNVVGHRWDTRFVDHDKEFVDWIEYKLTTSDGQVVVAMWRCEGSGSLCAWNCPIFEAHNESGWGSGSVKVQTIAGWDPLLGLLLAHLCSTEYSPDQIMADFVPNFPGRNSYRHQRPHGNFFQPYQQQGGQRPEGVLNGGAYQAGISIAPDMFCALPGYQANYFVNPPEEEPEAEPIKKMTPAHMETNEDGLLVFVPISWETLEEPEIKVPPADAPPDMGLQPDPTESDGDSDDDGD